MSLHPPEPDHSEHPGRQKLAIALAALVTVPGIVVQVAGMHPTPLLAAAIFALAVVGAAFMLAWAAEVVQLDISAGLAIALLALIAVLPEYAVDFVFTWKAGKNPEEYAPEALANMTGGNQLLIGVGWSLVVLLAAWRVWLVRRGGSRRNIAPDAEYTMSVDLERSHAVEISFLVLATAYGLTLPLKRTLTLVDAVVLVTIFVVYMFRIARAPAEEPHLVGPAQLIGSLPVRQRRLAVGGLALASVIVILVAAEPFAESLKDAGRELNVEPFLVVQLIAPLASEAPELIVAGLFAWRLNTNAGLGTLVSSKVNQWTLLVGTLPIVFAISSSSLHGLPIDAVQRDELFVTAAQSAFAVAVLANRSMSIGEAVTMLGLWLAQLMTKFEAIVGSAQNEARIMVGVIYLVLAAIVLYGNRRAVRPLLHDGFRAPYSELSEPESVAA